MRMANFFDYMQWRGDLSFEQAPFNEVDYLIMSWLVYVPFEHIVPSSLEQPGVSLCDAALRFIHMAEEDEEKLATYEKKIEFLRKILLCERFCNIKLCGYIQITEDDVEEQFCAMTAYLSDKTNLVLYRGTDGTMIGWKEDFNMSFSSGVPSQRDAAVYLDEVAQSIVGSIRVAGHSKGGNLAMYAAAFCKPQAQERIIEIMNMDGPGFNEDIIEKKEFLNIYDRMVTYLPQSSVVGLLLENTGDCSIIKSDGVSVFQHDPYTWQISGNSFVKMEHLTRSSQFVDRTLKRWLSTMDRKHREQLVDGIYAIITTLRGTDGKASIKLSQDSTLAKIIKASDGTLENVLEAISIVRKNMEQSTILTNMIMKIIDVDLLKFTEETLSHIV
jgi:hypothetical protein